MMGIYVSGSPKSESPDGGSIPFREADRPAPYIPHDRVRYALTSFPAPQSFSIMISGTL
jgi:hypothetical protein